MNHYFTTTLDQVADTESEAVVEAYAEIDRFDDSVTTPDVLTINGREPSRARAMQIDRDALWDLALSSWREQLDLWRQEAEEARADDIMARRGYVYA